MSELKPDSKKPKLYCIRIKDKDLGCSPKKCTALKLERLGLLRIITKVSGSLKNAILLNPFSEKEISVNDRNLTFKYGIIVIDCSWKRILNFKDFQIKNGRKLPPLLAVNPTNYGKWEKLSSVEALAAALYITDHRNCADLLLSKFSWGNNFLKLNKI